MRIYTHERGDWPCRTGNTSLLSLYKRLLVRDTVRNGNTRSTMTRGQCKTAAVVFAAAIAAAVAVVRRIAVFAADVG